MGTCIDGIFPPLPLPGSITNDLLADMPAKTVKGNDTGAPASPQDLTGPELNALVGENQLTLTSITAAFRTNVLDDTQEGALTPVNGMIHYNSDKNKFRIFENGKFDQITLDTVEIIRTEADFPAPIMAADGNMRIPLVAGKKYFLDTKLFTLTTPFLLPSETTGFFAAWIMQGTGTVFVYTGTPTLFYNPVDFQGFELNLINFSSTMGAQLFDLKNPFVPAACGLREVSLFGFSDLGTVDGAFCLFRDMGFFGFSSPLLLNDVIAFNSRNMIVDNSSLGGSINSPAIIMTGTTPSMDMSGASANTLKSGESFLAIDSAMTSALINIRNTAFPGTAGTNFFQTDLAGTITDIADGTTNPGTEVTVTTAAPHGLTVRRTVTQAGTINYNGTFTITKILSTTQYEINTAFVINESPGAATFLTESLDQTDLNVEATSNDALEDSKSVAISTLSTPETVTIGGIGTYVPINGINWIDGVLERFTATSAGVITYIGVRPLNVNVTATSTVEKVGGGSNIIATRISINGVDQSVSTGQTQNGTPTQVTSIFNVTLNTGDTISLEVANLSAIIDIIVSQSLVSIR